MEGDGSRIMIRKLRTIRNESGITLIEVMIASFLALTVALGIGSFQVTISQFFKQGSERLRLQQNVHRTAEVISIGVRKAADSEIFDPADPAKALLAGPAVRLLDAAGNTIGVYRRSDDGKKLVNGSGDAIDDMRLVDLWFERNGSESVVLSLGLADRYGHESEVFTEIAYRN
jgi:hypothetical protein